MQRTTTGRGLALAAGILATAGALAILLQDAIRTNTWALEHGLIPVLMAVQILTAHSVINAARSRRFGSALGFLIVAAVATWGVLYTSVGKQSKVAAENVAAAEDVNARLAQLGAELAKNKAMLDEAQKKLLTECASGKGKRCDGIAATVKVYADAVAGVESKIEKVGPLKPVAPNADKMAELISVIAGADRSTAKHILLLIEPFTYATIFELAALVSFGFAFAGHSPAIQSDNSGPAKQRIPGNRKPPNGGRRGRKPDTRIVQFSDAYSRKHGRAPTGAEIQKHFPDCPRSTAYDYASRARA
jgi:Flp pilus assembly pilin Flp